MDFDYSDAYELIDPDKAYHKVYWDSCTEFEEVREICLSDKDNWLRENYTKQNLVIEDHRGFAVSFRKDTHEPIVMGGVYASGLWSQHTARILNRMYIFPKYRCKGVYGLAHGWVHVNQHILQPLMDENNYKLYTITMQDRGRPSHNFFRGMVRSFQIAIPDWIEDDRLIKSCGENVKQCYQYFMYHEREPGYFENWGNKPLITKEEWSKLPEGK